MGTLDKAYGYQKDKMNLPVADLAAALPFYLNVLGFRLTARTDVPHKSVTLARDSVEIGLAENGGDPSQDGCAFHVTDVESLYAEFTANGFAKADPAYSTENHGPVSFKVLYVTAPDGLCYWFGERVQP
jgi:lactoylglutathione lyase